jgi:hypothetical protein
MNQQEPARHQKLTPVEILNEQLRMLKRIRMCAEIWSLIGVIVLVGQCLGLLAAAWFMMMSMFVQ